MGLKAPEQIVKTPYEEVLKDFDFADDLDTGETILSSPAPTITITPTTAPPLLAAGIVVSGAKVQARYSGGLAGTVYHISCRCETTTQKRETCGDMLVEEC
jgi:hypothetical protein